MSEVHRPEFQTNTTVRPKGAYKAIVASSIGNLMENYDNLIYGYLAVFIGFNFFPSDDPATSLLATFATFAVGFVARPIGTLVFGHIGDRYGRKPALLISVFGMAAVTILIGILPTYDTIGVVAAVLLVALRMCQGMAVAGEWAGSAALLVEYAPKHLRGFYGSFNQVSTAAGFLSAAAVVTGITTILTEEQMYEWGWRVPFLLGAVTGVAGILLRFGLADTPFFREEKAQESVAKAPILVAVRTQFPAIVRGFAFTVIWTVAYFFFLTYIPTFLIEVIGVDSGFARWSNLIALVLFMVLIAPMGYLSDKFGRKTFLLIGAFGFVLLSFPVVWMFTSGDHTMVLIGQLLIAVILASFSGPGVTALSEFFPTNVRYSALGIGYNFSVMVFGGTAPMFATLIVGGTNTPILVALIPTVAGLITASAIVTMRETYKQPLR